MQTVHCSLSESSLYLGVDNKRLTLVAATAHWTLRFCIALCSVDLLGLVVEFGLVLDFDDDGG